MDQYLYKYLVLEKHLCIPQVGSFLVQRKQAWLDESTATLHGPAEQIVFSDGMLPASEKFFFDFLAAEMGIDEVAAIKQFHDFSYAFRTHLSEMGWAELEGVGRISKNEDGTLAFEPSPRYTDLYPVLRSDANTASEMVEEVVEEEQIGNNKDNWWIYAIILLILGAGALLLYYS